MATKSRTTTTTTLQTTLPLAPAAHDPARNPDGTLRIDPQARRTAAKVRALKTTQLPPAPPAPEPETTPAPKVATSGKAAVTGAPTREDLPPITAGGKDTTGAIMDRWIADLLAAGKVDEAGAVGTLYSRLVAGNWVHVSVALTHRFVLMSMTMYADTMQHRHRNTPSRMEHPMQRISLFLTVPQYRALKTRADRRGLKFAELIRRAIDQFLKHEKE